MSDEHGIPQKSLLMGGHRGWDVAWTSPACNTDTGAGLAYGDHHRVGIIEAVATRRSVPRPAKGIDGHLRLPGRDQPYAKTTQGPVDIEDRGTIGLGERMAEWGKMHRFCDSQFGWKREPILNARARPVGGPVHQQGSDPGCTQVVDGEGEQRLYGRPVVRLSGMDTFDHRAHRGLEVPGVAFPSEDTEDADHPDNPAAVTLHDRRAERTGEDHQVPLGTGGAVEEQPLDRVRIRDAIARSTARQQSAGRRIWTGRGR